MSQIFILRKCRLCALVWFISLLTTHCYSQQAMPPDFSTGKKLFEGKKYEDAVASYYSALWELNRQPKKDSVLYAEERTLLSSINECYREAEKHNIPFAKTDFDLTKTEQFYFFVTAVNSINTDSAIITVSQGRQDGIYLGAECYLAAAYSSKPEDTARSLKYLGYGKITELSDYTAKVLIKFYTKRKGAAIYPNDLFEIKLHPVRNSCSDLITQLAKLNVSPVDNGREEFLCKRAVYLNTNPALADVLAGLYTQEIQDFAPTLDGMDGDQFVAKYKEGRFKGYNLKQVFHSTAAYDLLSFFNYVKDYFSMYMPAYKINEIYATWVLNNAPQGTRNRDWMIPLVELVNQNALDELLRETGFYIQSDSLGKWDKRIDEISADNKNLADAESLCRKFLLAAKYTNDTEAIAKYSYRLALFENAAGNKKDALADARTAYSLRKDSFAYAFIVASFYGQNEKYEDAFAIYKELLKKYPESSNLKGSYGWYKILAGSLDEAIPLCRDAYLADTNSHSWAVNYGHTFLLKGNVDSAKFYYAKMLENLYTPENYTDGAKKDFEIFFSKGWERKNAADIAEWLDNEFKQKYYYITNSNVLWSEGKKLYDAKDYSSAIVKWKEAIRLLMQIKEPKFELIRVYNTWIGSSFSSLDQNDSAIKYYAAALQISMDHLSKNRNTDPENDYLAKDYQNLSVLYENDKKYPGKAGEYKAMHEAEVRRLADLNIKSRLHILSIGGKDTTDDKSYESNAKLFFDNITSITGKKDSAPDFIYATGAGLSKKTVLQKLAEIRKQTKPEDVFIFYYDGISSTDSSKQNENLVFNPDDPVSGRISVKELLQNIDLLYAKKKVFITGEPDPGLLATLTNQYTGPGYSGEIVFLSPAVKAPLARNGNSIFTQELANAITDLKKQEQFSAKEFADRVASRFGMGQHYLPVLSFAYGRDFFLYRSDSLKKEIQNAQNNQSRGLEIEPANIGNEPGAYAATDQKNYALFFASDSYDDKDTWHQLSNPIADATALSKLLSDDYGFEVELVQNPTEKEIKLKLREYRDKKNFGINDQLFVFFAGHGFYDQDGNMGYLVARDSKNPKVDRVYDSYISYSDLGRLLGNLHCKRIFLALDACYAGSFFEQKSFRGGPDIRPDDPDIMRRLAMLKKNATGKTYYKGVSSGGKETVEDGKKNEHSPFAAGLIELLNNAIARSYITADAIIGDIQDAHPGNTTPSSGSFNYSDPQGIFIFEVKTSDKNPTLKTDKFSSK